MAGSFKTTENGSQKLTHFKTLAKRVERLNPRYMVPVNEASQIISDPQTAKTVQPMKDEPSSGPPPKGSRFNPIYMEPRSTSIDSTRDLQALFPNSVDCIGDMSGEYDIKIDPTVLVVQHGRWKVPIEYKEEMGRAGRDDANRLSLHHGSALSNTPKKANGKLRICLNLNLNKAIIYENHKAPTLKEIAHVLTEATKFSKVDGNKAFFGMHLMEAASLLMTFNTHLSRYRFLRVPSGLKMSQDIFQMRMDDIVDQCPGVLAIDDDVFIYGKDNRDHDVNIMNLFNIAQKKGLAFTSSKCSIKQDSMTFFRSVFSANGYSPDPEKIQGITEMTPPQTKQELQLFLGAVNYLQTFVSHLSHHTEPLHALLKRRTASHGMRTQTQASRKLNSYCRKHC